MIDKDTIVTFEKTAKQLALGRVGNFLICLIVGGVFAFILIFLDDLPLAVLIAAGAACILAIIMGIALLREARALLKAGEGCRVTVTDQMLDWSYPISKQMQSFTIPLNEIDKIEQRVTRSRSGNGTPKTDFFIYQSNGSKKKLLAQHSGIYPRKVFLELERRGVTFETNNKRIGSRVSFKVSS